MYNQEDLPQYVKTAGKISILTAFVGMLVFAVAFIFDFGAKDLNRVSAQSQATTTLTVLNTPPFYLVEPYEAIGSSSTQPTNSGDEIRWEAIAEDSNDAPYFLLVCSTNATPTAGQASGIGNLGTAPPSCGPGAIQWAVSTSTVSETLAFAATTTVDRSNPASLFNEQNEWYAWVCDDDPVQGECSASSQGLFGTSSSPFFVNSRPVFTAAGNSGAVDPGDNIVFTSSSTDDDTFNGFDGDDNLFLVVCATNSYDPTTDNCTDPADTIASTILSFSFKEDPAATTSIGVPTQDQSYEAYYFVRDQFGHEATNTIQFDYTVNNVAPTVASSTILMFGQSGGVNLEIFEQGGETPSSTLNFTIEDANSCEAAGGGPEFSTTTGFAVSIYRSSSTDSLTNCDPLADPTGQYNPNRCYPSGVGPDVWALTCTATTTCSDPTNQTGIDFTCDFPLWFVADPTDGGPFSGDDWRAAVQGIDTDFATGTLSVTDFPRQLESALYMDIVDAAIAYGDVAPGDQSGTPPGTLTATSVVLAVGNVGLDHEIQGEAMCPEFSATTTCSGNPDNTIEDFRQQYATTTTNYGAIDTFALASTTPLPGSDLELDVPKTTATSSPSTGTTFWGIEVPSSIIVAGAYTGLNTFTAVTDEFWQ
jgi:hypothetical protein